MSDSDEPKTCNFYTGIQCQSRKHCQRCRLEVGFRWMMWQNFPCLGNPHYGCPYGITEDGVKSRGLGDTIRKLINRFKLKWFVRKVYQENNCGCQKRIEKLNEAVPYKDGILAWLKSLLPSWFTRS